MLDYVYRIWFASNSILCIAVSMQTWPYVAVLCDVYNTFMIYVVVGCLHSAAGQCFLLIFHIFWCYSDTCYSFVFYSGIFSVLLLLTCLSLCHLSYLHSESYHIRMCKTFIIIGASTISSLQLLFYLHHDFTCITIYLFLHDVSNRWFVHAF